MSDSKPTSQNIDRVLLLAWRRLMYYNNISTKEKDNFIQLRKIVILLTLGGTVAAVLVLLLDFLPNMAVVFIGFLALALPILAMGFMQYTSRYAAPTTWIQYRYAAEKIRSNIYLYRAEAGPYHIALHERDNVLQMMVEQAENIINTTVPTQKQQQRRRLAEAQAERADSNPPLNDYELAYQEILPALKYSENDDGFSLPISMEQYVKTRVHGQINWYRGRVEDDYDRAKSLTRWSLGVTAVGTFFALALGSQQVQWVGLVALANALSVAVNAWGNARMFGKTYGIYDKTARKLENREARWHAVQNDPYIEKSDTPEKRRRLFIEEIEAILMSELQSWYDIATETQLTNDQMMVNNIRDLQTDTLQTPDRRAQAIINQFMELSPQDRQVQAQLVRDALDKMERDENATKGAPPPAKNIPPDAPPLLPESG